MLIQQQSSNKTKLGKFLWNFSFVIFWLLTLTTFGISYAKAQSQKYSYQLYEPNVPNDIKIILSPSSFKEFHKLFDLISQKDETIIRPIYRKKLKASIFVKSESNLRRMAGNVRISGDLHDHISKDKGYASLKVSLKNDHIGHITNFRLALAHTKRGKYDVMWGSLMETLGFPVPYRKLVNVDFNGKQYKAIFVESSEKEFLERYSFRESPIVEMDERSLWETGSWDKNEEYCLTKSHIKNCDTWKGKGPVAINGYKIDNAPFLKNKTAFKIAMKAMEFNPYKIAAYRQDYFEKVNKKYAAHGLGGINLKLLFDPIYNHRIHIYSDGNVNPKKCKSSDVKWESAKLTHHKLYLEWLNKYRIRANINGNISKEVDCVVKSVLLEYNPHSTPTVNDNETPNPSIYVHKSEFTDKSGYLYASTAIKQSGEIPLRLFGFNTDTEKFELCNALYGKIDSCTEVSDIKKIKRFLGGNVKPKKYRNVYSVYPVYIGKYTDNDKKTWTDNSRVIIRDLKQSNINVPENTILFIELTPQYDALNLVLEDPLTSKVVLTGNVKEGFRLVSKAQTAEMSDPSIRYDRNLLTSCITIMDMHLTNTYFDITGGGCEDSINFIRTTGTINFLKVKNSPYDAVDMDFSDINILKASIDNAGNDCFDVSAGSYKVKNLTLDTCHDKGVSVGERSQFFIEDAIVSSTNVAMAAKDSSTLWINSLTTNNTKGYCLEAYRKKQEFNGAEIFINKLKCQSSSRHDRLSKIEFVEENSLCNTNYQFYDIAICVRKYDIKISQSKSSMSEIKLSDINFDGDVSSKIDLSSKCSKNMDCVVLLKKPSTSDTSHAVISFSGNDKKTFINKDITW